VGNDLAGVPWLDRETIERKAELERRHWWYRGRRKIVGAAISRLRVSPPCQTLDLGCGTGAGMALLSRFGPVSGVDVNPLALQLARRRSTGPVFEGSAERIPFEGDRFGLITCLDVLEHVEDDGVALVEAARVAKPGGYLLVTAPAYPRLFSGHDVAAGHRRRYSLGALRSLAADAGWSSVFATHFNAFLLPPAVVRRLLTRSTSKPRSDLLVTPHILDPPLYGLLAIEAGLIGAGVRLPAGLSILLALRRPG
jgi:SAM-dependent methyltransferase